MTASRLSLVVAGAAASAFVAFAGVIAQGPALERGGLAARLPAPLVLLLAVYGLALGLGWLVWGRK